MENSDSYIQPMGWQFGNIYQMHITFDPELLLLGIHLVGLFLELKSRFGDGREDGRWGGGFFTIFFNF